MLPGYAPIPQPHAGGSGRREALSNHRRLRGRPTIPYVRVLRSVPRKRVCGSDADSKLLICLPLGSNAGCQGWLDAGATVGGRVATAVRRTVEALLLPTIGLALPYHLLGVFRVSSPAGEVKEGSAGEA